jgi:hypothetical protein
MMKRVALLCLISVLTALPAGAQTPTPGGGKATIEFLYNRLLALEARVAQLDARTSDTVTEASLVGATFQMSMLGIEFGQAGYVATEGGDIMFRLNADHSVTASLTDEPGRRCKLNMHGAFAVSCQAIEDEGTEMTWQYADGVLRFVDSEDRMTWLLGAGGKIAMTAGAVEFQPGYAWSVVAIAIRLS